MTTFDPRALKNSSFGDRYEVLDVLGQGGMGAVLKARQLSLGKLVAIKVLNPVYLADSDSRKRFEQEAQTGSSLTHPNLITVFDYGYTDENEPYLVMEFINGEALDTMLQHSKPGVDEILPVIIQVCKALRYLHQSGIIHRDLKPANVMVSDIAGERYAKLVDLGIAKIRSVDGNPTQHLTSTGAIFGSPLYMSPEQCRGEKVDMRSDIYSLGCVLYECMIGEVPFLGENPLQTLHMHINEHPAPIPCANEVEYELARITSKCLQKDRAQRYQDVGELLKELTSLEARMIQGHGLASAHEPQAISLQAQLDAIPTPKSTRAQGLPFAESSGSGAILSPDGQFVAKNAGANHGPAPALKAPSSYSPNDADTFAQPHKPRVHPARPTNLQDAPMDDLAKEILIKAYTYTQANKWVVTLGVVAFVLFYYWWQSVTLGFQLDRNFRSTVNSLQQLERAQSGSFSTAGSNP